MKPTKNLVGVIGLVLLATLSLGCGGDAALRAAGQALHTNDVLLRPYTVAGIDAAEAAGTLSPTNAQLARELSEANTRLIRELRDGRSAQ